MSQGPYFKELSIVLRQAGFTVLPEQDEFLPVEWEGQALCWITGEGSILYRHEAICTDDLADALMKAEELVGTVREYVEAVQNAPLLHASGLHEDFHLLADFGGAVLAGRERPGGAGYQFVTWTWDYDRTGVSHGHYYDGNFQSAKQDFAVRSGLISRAQLFTPEELTELYRATDHFLEEGPELDSGQLKAIQEARTKIEYTVSDLQSRLEQTQNQEPQMNL